MKKNYSQLAVVTFKSQSPFIVKLKSKEKITIVRAAEYFEKADGFDPDEDSLDFVSDGEKAINLDKFNS